MIRYDWRHIWYFERKFIHVLAYLKQAVKQPLAALLTDFVEQIKQLSANNLCRASLTYFNSVHYNLLLISLVI